jgi:hypothetical protein
MGTPIFYMGTQENGGNFTDSAGKQEFAGDGEIGMLDWGAYTPKAGSSLKGIKALDGGKGRGYSMARTLGSDPNQVAVAGRRTVVAWVSAAFTSQSLLQDLTLGPDNQLRQQFVPELTSLRMGSPIIPTTKVSHGATIQCEVVARATSVPGAASGVSVLVSQDGKSSTKILVDFGRQLVMVDATEQGNDAIRAGPLLGDASKGVTIHAYVDHSIIAVIFNNRTSLTVSVAPPDATADGVATIGKVDAQVYKLATANSNECAQENPEFLARVVDGAADVTTASKGGPRPAHLLPKIHNSPACLSGRKPGSH